MKRFMANAALIIVSILIAYGLMEAVFRVGMPLLPKGLFNNQCRELRTVGQTSFKGKSPVAPYIAIVGDSYGAGMGDWFIENKYSLNSRFQASHILNDLTGKDVVSYSRAGAGNYDGAGIFPINTSRFLNDVGFDYPEPETVIVYFYEGNDIGDNLRFIERYYKPEFDMARFYDNEYFASFDREMEDKYCQGTLPKLENKFLVANMISRFIEGIIYSATKKYTAFEPGEKYLAVLDGKETMLPDRIEIDPTKWNDEQTRQGVRMFERALHRLARFWPDAEKYVVYLPSALTTYAVVGDDAAKRLQKSVDIEVMVREAAVANGYVPLEFSSAIRKAAQKEIFHGPKDWYHFNRNGYTFLASYMSEIMKTK